MAKKDLIYFATLEDERKLISFLDSIGCHFLVREAQSYGHFVSDSELAELSDRLVTIFTTNVMSFLQIDVTKKDELDSKKRLYKECVMIGWTRSVDANQRLMRGYLRFEYEAGKKGRPVDALLKETFKATHNYFKMHFQPAESVGFKGWFVTPAAAKRESELVGA